MPKKIITTLRGSISASHNTWAGVLYDGKNLFITREYQITDIVDSVGGGDSFMGAGLFCEHGRSGWGHDPTICRISGKGRT